MLKVIKRGDVVGAVDGDLGERSGGLPGRWSGRRVMWMQAVSSHTWLREEVVDGTRLSCTLSSNFGRRCYSYVLW